MIRRVDRLVEKWSARLWLVSIGGLCIFLALGTNEKLNRMFAVVLAIAIGTAGAGATLFQVWRARAPGDDLEGISHRVMIAALALLLWALCVAAGLSLLHH